MYTSLNSIPSIFLYLVLRYADGVLPGQGSPDHTEECSGTGTSTHSSAGTTAASGALSVKRSVRQSSTLIIDYVLVRMRGEGAVICDNYLFHLCTVILSL